MTDEGQTNVSELKRLLAERTAERDEARAHRAAAAEVLQVIGQSMADAQPVFERIVDSIERLIPHKQIGVFLVPGDGFVHAAAMRGLNMDFVKKAIYPMPVEQSAARVVIEERRQVYFPDVLNGAGVPPGLRRAAAMAGNFSDLLTPMLWQGRGIGNIAVTREPNVPFKDQELVLLQTFADQAVIAIENARLFDEVQARTRDLQESLQQQTGTAEVLGVIASSPTDVKPVLNSIVGSACKLCDASDAYLALKDGEYLVFQAQHGLIPVAWKRRPINRQWPAGRAVVDGKSVHLSDVLASEGDEFPDGREIARRDGARTVLTVPLMREGESVGVMILRRTQVQPFTDKQIALLKTFADQAVIAIGNVRLFDQVQARTRELSQSLENLRAAQDRLVQTEKLASLGQLTAGIAHEIKNPLNFVNNFAALSAELTDELDETLAPAPLDQKMRVDVGELTQMLKSNLEKVVQHGKRADSIVKNMLLHSREGSGERRSADINALVGESLNLAYHGARAEKAGFSITLKHDLDPEAGAVELYPQEMTRALLNLISNGFYAATRRKVEAGDGIFEPILSAATRNLGMTVEIRIRDNGTGIPSEVREKIFNPFFTTKPTGEGTGLGLSMTHDIIVKQHGGRIEVETELGAFTEFIITLPRGNGTAIGEES